jgi:acyl-CoA thioesterase
VAFTLNFAAPLADGPFTICTRAARTNRSTQHWVIEARQASGVVALATAVFAERRPTWSDTEAQTPQNLPSPSSLARMPTENRPAWVQRYDMRFIEGAFPDAFDGQEQAHSQSRLWVRDHPPRPLDYPALMAISDSFFPRIFVRRRKPSPIGTVSITTYFHADEAAMAAQSDHYVIGTARANTFHQGFFDQSGELWSHQGQLLATTHQTVYFKD